MRSLLWFRKGLRLHDNPALARACEGAAAVQPIFVLDPWFLSPERVGANRVRFLLESLEDLDASLRARGSTLLVLHGDPVKVVPAALERWRCGQLCYEADSEPYALTRDMAVTAAANALGVEVHAAVSHTLYDTERLLAKCPKGEPPTVYNSFLKIAASLGPPPKPVPAPPAKFPGPLGADLVADLGALVTGHGIPTLEALGYPSLPVGKGFPARWGWLSRTGIELMV